MPFRNPLQRLILGDGTTEIIIDPAYNLAELQAYYNTNLESLVSAMIFKIRDGFYYWRAIVKPSAGSGGIEYSVITEGIAKDGVLNEYWRAQPDPIDGTTPMITFDNFHMLERGITMNNALAVEGNQLAVNGIGFGGRITMDGLDLWPADRGTYLASGTAVDFISVSVSFNVTFPAAPRVFVNIRSSSGTVIRWDARASSVTTTGFTLFMFANATGATSTFTDIPVDWLAVYG